MIYNGVMSVCLLRRFLFIGGKTMESYRHLNLSVSDETYKRLKEIGFKNNPINKPSR